MRISDWSSDVCLPIWPPPRKRRRHNARERSMAEPSAPAVPPPDLVCVGAVAGAQGVRGDLRIKPFTADPAAVAAYGTVTAEAGRRPLTHTVRVELGRASCRVRVCPYV